MRKHNEKISHKQRERIHESYTKNTDRVADSETFEAVEADVSIFGKERAFNKEKDKS